MLQVKVPIIFFGTQGFSARKDRQYGKILSLEYYSLRGNMLMQQRVCRRHSHVLLSVPSIWLVLCSHFLEIC
jgi:hypothetical protein